MGRKKKGMMAKNEGVSRGLACLKPYGVQGLRDLLQVIQEVGRQNQSPAPQLNHIDSLTSIINGLKHSVDGLTYLLQQVLALQQALNTSFDMAIPHLPRPPLDIGKQFGVDWDPARILGQHFGAVYGKRILKTTMKHVEKIRPMRSERESKSK
ncbi:Uncharacterized protein Fot_11177 [Forsythia ovata]|uniref:Uncharacterized protein n=1 Tax=Forsythia ovata TaxID=205694 RepID=A0ABD1WJC8_9LAMI